MRNANFVWPGALHLAEYLMQPAQYSFLQGKRLLELGSGTGALAIYLTKKKLQVWLCASLDHLCFGAVAS